MSKLAVWAFAGLLVGTAGVMGADQNQNTGAGPTITSPFTGVVTSVSANSVTVKGEVKAEKTNANDPNGAGKPGKKAVTFVVKTETKLTKDGKECKITEIQKGEQATVTFTTRAGTSQRTVTDIAIGAGGAADAGDKKDAKAADKPAEPKKKEKKDK